MVPAKMGEVFEVPPISNLQPSLGRFKQKKKHPSNSAFTLIAYMPKTSTTIKIYGGFQKIGVPQNGWLMMENPIKVDDLGVPLFSETPIYKKNRG